MILSIGEDTSGALTSIYLKKILLSIIRTKARSESMKREEKNEVGERFFTRVEQERIKSTMM